MKKKVLLGMSGGVDSSVSAIILREAGYEVEGVFMQIWDDAAGVPGQELKSACYGPEEDDIADALAVAETLGIELHLINLKREYRETVLSYFREEYLEGRTPNPCVVCNRFIKFGLLPERAAEEGVVFDFFATGHYARVAYKAEESRYVIEKGVDGLKEQSYFLFMLTPAQLSMLKLPLGTYTKKEVRGIAERAGLCVSEKKESQDFIAGDRGFMFGLDSQGGDIVDMKGEVLGAHKGIEHYTIGQRRGLGLAAGEPVYVVDIDPESRRVVIGGREDVYKSVLSVSDVNLTGIDSFSAPLEAEVKIRYKHPPAAALISPCPEGKGRLLVEFEEPQWAPTKGQAAVFYRGERLLGGGFIDRVF